MGKGWRRDRTKTCPVGHLLYRVRADKDRHGNPCVRRWCAICHRNRRRKTAKGSPHWRRLRTTCDKGHALTGANLGITERRRNGKWYELRRCMTCRRASWRRYAEKNLTATASV